jgi:hypothetical protein
LKSGEPQENMRLAKSISFNESDGLPPSTVHLYADIINPDLVYAFLEQEGNRYDVGVEHSDFQGHPTQRIDMDGDGKEELVGNNVTDVPPYIELHRWNAISGKRSVDN